MKNVNKIIIKNRGADLRGAYLRGADLGGAEIKENQISDLIKALGIRVIKD